MGRDKNYQIPNQSGGKVTAPTTIKKDAKKPNVTKGGDLRSKGSN